MAIAEQVHGGRRVGPVAWMLLVLAPLALVIALVDLGPSSDRWADLTRPTLAALIVQTAALSLALAAPLRFGDLDLSVGGMAVLGMMLAVSWAGGAPADLAAVLPVAALAGLACGTVNGLLAGATRLPVAAVTLGTGTALIALLSQAGVHLAVPAATRVEVLEASLVVLGLGAVLVLAGDRLAARWIGGPERLASETAASSGPAERLFRSVGRFRAGRALLVLASWAVFVLFALDPARTAPLSESRAPLAVTIALPLVVASAVAMVGLTAARVSGGVLVTTRGWVRATIVLVPVVGLLALPNGVWPIAALLLAPVVAVPLAVLVLLMFHGPAHRWVGRPVHADPRGQLARVVVPAGSGTLAAMTGALMAAQGVRDAGFLSMSAYVAIVPLAGLIVGGLHLRTGRLGFAAGLAGAILTAALILAATQPGDNLAPAAVLALFLAAPFAVVWDWAARAPAG